jgi:hypothetical protein
MSKTPAMNRRIVLAERPKGAATLASFRLETVPAPAPGADEVLVRTLWLSLDPYMRGRMNDAPSYAPPVELGAVMTAQTVSRVELSNSPEFRAGDLVLAPSGWQDLAACPAKSLMRLPRTPHPSWALGVLGMTGLTAYVGLLDIGTPAPGETVVVAAATGAVGSIVGQIAKIKGCRVVGIAGGPEKCRWAVQELGFDACVDHRAPSLSESLAAACPQGIDVYFENVGGAVLRAVVPLLNTHARIPVCGLIAYYGGSPRARDGNAAPPDSDWSPVLMRSMLVKRMTMQGFIIFEHDDRYPEFVAAMQGWLRDGRIKYREDVVQGLENAPRAFLGLLEGRNFGKLVVQVADEAAPG